MLRTRLCDVCTSCRTRTDCLPLLVGVSRPVLQAPAPTRDKAYDRADLRKWLRGKRIGVRIARRGIESSERLGRRRWVIERAMSWLSGYRRLSPRYECNSRNYLALLGLAATPCCYKRLVRLTT
ncbi:hypothetical protein SMA5143A_7211 [Streptomyces sp. MA5143a]|nr:hypothetical protein SMA5143A_7211 [Streptomyces sp. MA5143a]